jgi:hypothetical protein
MGRRGEARFALVEIFQRAHEVLFDVASYAESPVRIALLDPDYFRSALKTKVLMGVPSIGREQNIAVQRFSGGHGNRKQTVESCTADVAGPAFILVGVAGAGEVNRQAEGEAVPLSAFAGHGLNGALWRHEALPAS